MVALSVSGLQKVWAIPMLIKNKPLAVTISVRLQEFLDEKIDYLSV